MSGQSRIQPIAILVGVITNVVGSVATALLLVIAMTAFGIPDAQILPRLNSFSGLMLKAMAVLGFAFTGGYFAGQIAGQRTVLHGGIVAAISTLMSILCWDNGLPMWYVLLHYCGMIPAGLIGGYAVMLQKKRPL
jgi:hypothetical protein